MSPLLPAAPPQGAAALAVTLVPGAIEFAVDGPATSCLAGVLLSLSPELACGLDGLPPLLVDHAIAGAGIVEQGSHYLSVPDTPLPPGIMIDAQGATFDAIAFLSSEAAAFVLDASSQG